MLNFFRRWFPSKLAPSELQLLDFISSNATLFGSRVWGGSTSKSDYDYYMPDTVHLVIRQHLDNFHLPWTTHDTYNHKFAFDRGTNLYLSDGRKLQLMSYDYDKLHRDFLQAISLMTIVSQSVDVTSKPYRYSCFEDCVNVFKGRPIFNPEVREIATHQYPELYI